MMEQGMVVEKPGLMDGARELEREKLILYFGVTKTAH